MASGGVVVYGGVSGAALLVLAQLPIRKQMLTMMCAEWLKILVKKLRGSEIPADILWFYGLSFIATAWHSLTTVTGDSRVKAMASMQLIWATRLATYLSHRPAGGAITGNSYGGATKKIGQALWFQLNYSFIAGLWRVLTCVPLWLRRARAERRLQDKEQTTEDSWTAVNYAGAAVWLGGLAVETVADLQKMEFNARNPGRFANEGLWRLSRHPNYFGEMLVWLGHFLVGAPYATPAEWFTASLSPIFTYLLLRYVSGVPLVTAAAKSRWRHEPGFEKYMRTTPVLVPWPR
eukprot:TRINITY_DN57095_c0_g1_i1.p1 TRINITY_DN57095_c0_g1~~TRINITY_DN57095_c0_g1_i1.p1  ORF type:complete len:305 (-),score=29.01 TRINITY_DN57095_c0_g1_i1:238-1110(-)